MKTIERAHSPKSLWEKVKLSRNYPTALQQITDQLQYWPNFLVHKAKQRLTKIHQYLIRMRRLKLQVRPQLVGIHKKVERREAKRETKALKAAQLEDAIKKEIIQRLQAGTYDQETILNFKTQAYEEALEAMGQTETEEIADEELVSDMEDEEELEKELNEEKDDGDEGQVQYVEAYDDNIFQEDDLEEMHNLSSVDTSSSSSSSSSSTQATKRSSSAIDSQAHHKRAKKAGPRLEISYEHETETESEVQRGIN